MYARLIIMDRYTEFCFPDVKEMKGKRISNGKPQKFLLDIRKPSKAALLSFFFMYSNKKNTIGIDECTKVEIL